MPGSGDEAGGYRFAATLDRHRPDLPVFLLVPDEVVDALGERHTFAAHVTVDGQTIGRRSIKPWATVAGSWG